MSEPKVISDAIINVRELDDGSFICSGGGNGAAVKEAMHIIAREANHDALVAMLKRLEWDAAPHWTGENCLLCGAHKNAGSHLDDCELAALLDEVGED